MSAAGAFMLAVLAGLGMFLLYTALALGWRGLGLSPRATTDATGRRRLQAWLQEAGLADVGLSELAAASCVLGVVGAGLAYAIFGGAAGPLLAGAFAASIPATSARKSRLVRRDRAREAWPRLIEEIRIASSSLGRSIPQALFDVGARAPAEMQSAFAAAHREWMLSTDFERALEILKARCADATADAVCETLLVAHQVGGADVERRLSSLAEDRIADLQGRKDAVSKQAGAKFARWFVLVVPITLALIGLTIGDGRAAYRSGGGQAAVALGLTLITLCWWWAGRLMRLPDEQRVFETADRSAT